MTSTESETDQGKYELDVQVGFLLRLASQRHSIIFQKHAPQNLTATQFSTLIRLSEAGEVSQNHLGRSAGMDAATAKGVVDRLKAKGLVKSIPDQVDKRRSIISLTEEGRALVGDLEKVGQLITEETLSPLTTSERRNLIAALQKVL